MDSSGWSAWDVRTNGTGTWLQSITVPDDNALAGLQVGCQGVMEGRSPSAFLLTNGLGLTAGY